MTDPVDLRRQAQKRIRSDQLPDLSAFSPEELTQMIEELQIHQFELEIQNEILRATEAELLRVIERFQQLYNFAPIGYLTLDAQHRIRGINFAGAVLFGQPRSALLDSKVTDWIAPEVQDRFYLYSNAAVDQAA